MRYIIPRFDCVLIGDKNIALNKNVQYLCEFVDNKKFIVVGKNNEIPFSFDMQDNSFENVEKVVYKSDEYFFLNSKPNSNQGIFQFKYQNKQVCVGVFNNLVISIDGETVLNERVEGISYSHNEIKNQICFIYFSGKRNYVVVIYNGEIQINSFYDEVNINENEYFYMCKLYDSLNHGRVFHIKDKTFENYLVYLDDNDLKLKEDFVGCVFLDCVLSGNLSYANNLLSEDLNQKNADNISKFFVEFDYFFAINKYEFILLKKNTLAGIYSFEINNLKITNIIQQV